MPPTLPRTRGRRASFDDSVSAAFAHLGGHTPEVLRCHLHVTDVPDHLPDSGEVPLGEVDHSGPTVRLVVHRRPVLMRAQRTFEDYDRVVRDLLTELAADVLCRDPEELDPHYPRTS